MRNMLIGTVVGAAAVAVAVVARGRLEHEYVAGYAAGVGSMAEAKIGRAERLHDYLQLVAPELEPHELARAVRLATR
jgi:hypothetical protein